MYIHSIHYIIVMAVMVMSARKEEVLYAKQPNLPRVATAAPNRHSWFTGSKAATEVAVDDREEEEEDGKGVGTKACGELSAASARASAGSGKGNTKASLESMDCAMLSMPLRKLGPRRNSRQDTTTEPISGSGGARNRE